MTALIKTTPNMLLGVLDKTIKDNILVYFIINATHICGLNIFVYK